MMFLNHKNALIGLFTVALMVSGACTASDAQKPSPAPMMAPETTVKGISSMHDLGHWSTYYYLHPQPDLLPSAMHMVERCGILQAKPEFRAPWIAQMSQIFAKNPQLTGKLVQEMSSPDFMVKAMLWKALWQANTVASRAEANKLSPQFPQQNRPPLLDEKSARPEPIEKMALSPPVLDMLWASFTTTGDEKYVQRVMSALPGKNSKDRNLAATASVAEWSLIANAQQHKKVMGICMAAKQTHPEWKAQLNEITTKASAPPAKN